MPSLWSFSVCESLPLAVCEREGGLAGGDTLTDCLLGDLAGGDTLTDSLLGDRSGGASTSDLSAQLRFALPPVSVSLSGGLG